MIKELLQALIILFLLYGCYTDIKARHVSNKISFSIAAMALILISWELLAIKAAFIMFLIFSWYARLIGAADVKVLGPITLMLSPIQFIAFLSIFFTTGAGLGIIAKNKYKIPGFIPITSAFIITAFLPSFSYIL